MIFREVEDRDLIAKARKGDVEAYNLLVSRWEKRVFNYLLRLVGNREELELLQATRTALQALPQEEAPRRIAFVSDKIFEPRWWQRIWQSGPAMGFASSRMSG